MKINMYYLLNFEMFIANMDAYSEGRPYGGQLWLGYSTRENSISAYCTPSIMADGGNSAVIETVIVHWRSCFQSTFQL